MQAPNILNTKMLFYTFNDPHKVIELPTETAVQTFSKNLESTSKFYVPKENIKQTPQSIHQIRHHCTNLVVHVA
jgi:hypothetical protein